MDNILEVSELDLYFGDDYVINDKIVIHQPTIGEVVAHNEQKYFSTVSSLVAIPSDLKSVLWDQRKLDWNQVDDFELFCMIAPTLTVDQTSILFGDLDFSRLVPYHNLQNDEVVLADKEAGVKIDRLIYMRIVNYLRKLHNIKPKVEKAKNERTKQILIEDDRRTREFNKNKPFKSHLLPLISAIKVKQGYTKGYVRNMGLYEFYDDLARLQIIFSTDHLTSAVYAGTVDTKKKFDKNNLNWMREIDK